MKKTLLIALMLICAAVGCASAAVPAGSGPIASYKFHESDGIDGQTVLDQSMAGNNGTINGSAGWQQLGGGKALKMDGVDNINFGYNRKLDVSGKGLTAEAWFVVNTKAQFMILDKFTSDWKTCSRGWRLEVDKNNILRLYLGFGKDVKSFSTKPDSIQPGVPCHAIVTYDGEYVCMYVNGQTVLKTPECREIASNSAESLAMKRYYGKENPWTVDRVKIYNRAISPEEITASFNDDRKQGVYNVSAVDSIQSAKSRNLLINSTFTHCANPGIPDWWGTGMSSFIEKWDGCYGIDDAAVPPLDDVKCLRIIKSPEAPGRFWLSSTFTQLPSNQNYTFSIYMKASEPGLSVSIGGAGFPFKRVQVTQEWQRYTASGMAVYPPGRNYMCGVDVDIYGAGTVWLAAPQLEYGLEASPYHPSDQDDIVFGRQAAETQPIPTANVTRLSKAPVIDGNPDDWFKSASVLKDFKTLSGGQAPASAEACIACDDQCLYIGFRCPEPDSGKIAARCKENGSSEIFNDDSIEVFLSTTPDSSDGYVQLAGSASGALWTRDVDAKQCRYSARIGSGEWTAEFAIPFSAISGRNVKSPWRINLCRNRWAGQKSAEYSTWSCIWGQSYHAPARFGYLTGIEPGSIPYFVWSVDDMKLVSDPEGGISLTCKIKGKADALRKVYAEADICSPSGQKIPGAFRGTIKNSMPVQMISGIPASDKTGNYKINLKLVDKVSSSTVVSFNNELKTESVLAPLHMLTRYTFYTKDANAPLRLEWGLNNPVKIDLEIRDSVGKVYKPLKGIVSLGAFETREIQLPIDKLACGNYQISAYAVTGGKKTEIAKEALTKLPPGPVEVRMDKFKRMACINGKPVYLHGQFFRLFGVNSSWDGDTYTGGWRLDDIKAHGFNSIVSELQNLTLDNDEKKFQSFLDECNKRGIKVIFQIRAPKTLDFESYKNMEVAYVRRFKNHPAIIGWLMIDEPDGWWNTKNKEEDLTTMYKAVKEEDPYRPAMVNWMHWPPYGTLACSDVASLDRYPMIFTALHFYPGVVKDVVAQMNKDASPVGKPVLYYTQQWGYWDGSREPSVKEQRWMAYTTFILGTRMLYHFTYKPMSAELWDAANTLTGDLEAVFGRTAATGAREVAQKSKGDFLYSLWKIDKGYMLVVTNGGDKPVEGRIELNDLPEQVQVRKCKPLSGMGKLSVDKGSISVSLDGLDCGAYILN